VGGSVRRRGEHVFGERSGGSNRGAALWALQRAQAARTVCVAQKVQGSTRQLLPTLSRGLQAGALHRQSFALHRECPQPQASSRHRTDGVPNRLLRPSSLRRLWRERSDGARVRPHRNQAIHYRTEPPRSELAEPARRDCAVRGRLRELPSSANRLETRICSVSSG
jgi:hypothetical protein